MSKIIFLNGCSSAGKTSLVKAIQHLSEEFWLTFGVDTFFNAMPTKYVGFGEKASQGIKFAPGVDKEGFPIMEIKTGHYNELLNKSILRTIKQLADDGFNLILDEVIQERKGLENYALTLKDHQVYFVKVNCELPLMREREILRGDRSLGLAQAQYARMEELKWDYDLEIDTSRTNSFTNAQNILKFLKNKEPRAFAKNN